jgi:hypothetical protein
VHAVAFSYEFLGSLMCFKLYLFAMHMIDDIFNFTFDFSDIFVRPKTPTKKVTDVDKLAG